MADNPDGPREPFRRIEKPGGEGRGFAAHDDERQRATKGTASPSDARPEFARGRHGLTRPEVRRDPPAQRVELLAMPGGVAREGQRASDDLRTFSHRVYTDTLTM